MLEDANMYERVESSTKASKTRHNNFGVCCFSRPESIVVMTDVDKFINIFEGSYSAYGQTRKTEEFDERGNTKQNLYNKQNSKQMFRSFDGKILLLVSYP